MKNITIIICACICFILIGCKKDPQQEKPVVHSDEDYIVNYLATNEDFSNADNNIESGKAIKLEFITPEGSGEVEDKEFIKDSWHSLVNMKMNIPSGYEDKVNEEEKYIFKFYYEGGDYTLSFKENEYFIYEDKIYQLPKLTPIWKITEEAITLNKDNNNDANIEFADWKQDGSFFSWDLDNDGISEDYELKYYDNGDEAPSVYVIEKYDDSQEAYIDRAYDIYSLKPIEDNGQRYIEIHYEQGDYYNHDNEAICLLKLENNQLIVEYIDE